MSHLMISRFGNILKINSALSLYAIDVCSNSLVPSRSVWGNVNTVPKYRSRPNKHRDPKWSKSRAAKVLMIDLPDTDFRRKAELQQVTPEEQRAFYKKEGILPPKMYSEKPFFIASTGAIFDPYVPPEGDGRSSLLSKEGAREKMKLVTTKGKSLSARRKIKNYDEDFSTSKFVEKAVDIYIKAHEALARKDEKILHELVTEKLFPEMIYNTDRKTIQWQFIKSLEPPRVTHMRTIEVVSKLNYFGQITVRFHTQQILAVYDRFGRLIHGSPVVAKDVLEYVVFEKYLASLYGEWRMHAKIIPDWLRSERPSSLLTQVLPRGEPVEETVPEPAASGDAEDSKEDSAIYDHMGRKITSK